MSGFPSEEFEAIAASKAGNGKGGAEDLPAKGLATIEFTTGPRPVFVNRAKICYRVQSDAGAVAALL
jgi:hypothetical protein